MTEHAFESLPAIFDPRFSILNLPSSFLTAKQATMRHDIPRIALRRT
jgi:hypothetical protein